MAEYNTETLDKLKEQLTFKVIASDDPKYYGDGKRFDPWELFPCLYGSYSADFDDMAILTLDHIVNREANTYTKEGETLAHEMFREILCNVDLCEYGTSPRACFPNWGITGKDTPVDEIENLLRQLLEKWKEYRRVEWDGYDGPA